MRRTLILLAAAVAALPSAASATTIPVLEDVMTSAFFQGTNLVRGYDIDDRPPHRVASDNAFGAGPETVYLTFDPSLFAPLGSSAPQAILSVESVAGGFGAEASPANPFQMSAHGVALDPLASITDDTNPAGPIAWTDFFANQILPASGLATTVVSGTGTLKFDVTEVVNDWLSGANSVFALALTGKNDTLSDGNVLHGVANNSETPGVSHFISIVPEPSALTLVVVSLVAGVVRRRR
ncbi:hypothetical protein Mal64_09280 [Pseudobythopirellula maris]|uniref:PEP-CTERM protein-sorting domain-containing protein n=1 Tax=Pseudobythopirellula maris TaxID=2527991 RepID=A0A5C5ZTJ5_9BACT|nr:hypothetical protein [Pseudobythopirellula maris]TWT90536.1 hypothetical protein Mal64_09280 [Pseudobythopirellula maris]